MQAAGKIWVYYPGNSDVFTVWCLADLHVGNIGSSRSMIEEDIQAIKNDPYSLWIGGGDYADFISPGDKRWAAGAMDKDLKIADLSKLGIVLTTRVRDMFLPIKDKCLGLAFGNHESQYYNIKEQSHLHAWLCQELGAPNLEYSALFDIVFVRGYSQTPKPFISKKRVELPSRRKDSRGGCGGETHTKRVYIHHGAGAAQTPGGKINRLVQFMESFDADLYFVNHVHDRVAKRLTTVCANADCNKLTERVKLGLVSGSYLKTYGDKGTGYGEVKGYRPTTLGASKARITPRTGEMAGEV